MKTPRILAAGIVSLLLHLAPSASAQLSWDTNTAANGSHTITAVARDASGNRTTSEPVTVTVVNPPPAPPAARRSEESDASVRFSDGWSQSSGGWFAWSGGSAVESMLPGARASFTFSGPSVTWIGYRSGRSGIARVFVDGVFLSEVDLFARTDEARAPIITANGLAAGNHTLTIEVTGMKNLEAVSGVIQVDAFDVPGPAVSHLQDTDPGVSYAGGWARANPNTAWSAGNATAATTAGAQATLTFNGTSVSWNGYRGPDAGIARVYLDGVFAGEIDTYAPTHAVQGAVFTASDLADASHSLTIEATGAGNPASSGNLIVVDSFDVTAPGTRYQETDASILYSGGWTQGYHNRPWSEGTAAGAVTAGEQATLTFSGTAVSWIGYRGIEGGIARVYLDGAFVAEVDTYAATEGFQTTVFEIAGLPDTGHTLVIEATGLQHAAATNNYVVVDAFDVRP